MICGGGRMCENGLERERETVKNEDKCRKSQVRNTEESV